MKKNILIILIILVSGIALYKSYQFRITIEDLEEQNQLLKDSIHVVRKEVKTYEVISNQLKEELNELEIKLNELEHK